jgi:hypothetical protein
MQRPPKLGAGFWKGAKMTSIADEEAFEYWWNKIQEGRMPYSKYLAARFWKEALRWERSRTK